nr:hypothetical protein [Tanacetum cinerariifolium]
MSQFSPVKGNFVLKFQLLVLLEFRLEISVARPTVALANKCGYLRFISSSRSQSGISSSLTRETCHGLLQVHVSEPKPEPKLLKKKTSSKRRVKKKVTISVEDNIISDDLDIALELGKSISQTKAEEAEAAKKVYATHARIVTEFVLEPTRTRKSSKVTSNPPKKLKGIPSLTPGEQEVADIMQALKESRKSSRRQTGTRGSDEETGSITRVSDESTVGDEDDENGDADDEGDDHVSDTQDADDKDVKTKFDEDEIYKYKIRVHTDEDKEMKESEVAESKKGEEEITDMLKTVAEKKKVEKDDLKKAELPPTSSSLSISSSFCDQFLKLSSNSSLISTVKDTAEADVSSLLDIPIQQETPHIQSPPVQKVHVLVIPETANLSPSQEKLDETPVSIGISSPIVTRIISNLATNNNTNSHATNHN